MSEALENKAVEILDASQKAMGAFADKLADLAKQYGPEVADAALQMARVDAISTLTPAAIGLIISSIALLNGPRVWRKLKEWDRFDGAPVGTIYWIASGAVWVPSIFHFLDVWAWVGIFEPKLWLAKRILGL